jgi:ribosomal protein S27E
MSGTRPAWFASLFAGVTAPVSEAISRAILNAMPRRAAGVDCPRCGKTIAVPAGRRLYRLAKNGGAGFPLPIDSRGNAVITCDRCGVTWHKSARAVLYDLRAGRPPLALAR